MNITATSCEKFFNHFNLNSTVNKNNQTLVEKLKIYKKSWKIVWTKKNFKEKFFVRPENLQVI